MVKTRPLRESDKEDILEISRNTWDGHDYLPHYFEEWLKDDKCHTLAIEEEGHVAALANLKIIEAGVTGWMEGLRVHPKFRGKGYASILTDYLVEMARGLGVQRLRYTTATENEPSLHLASKIGMERVFDLGVYWDSELSRFEWEIPATNIVQLNIEKEHSLVSSSNLIPRNIVVLDWKVYDATLEGFRALDDVEVWAHKENNNITSVSIGKMRHDMHGEIWAFTIHTREEHLFLEHLSHHIQRARQKGLNRIMMHYSLDFFDALYNIDWVHHDHKEIGIVILEKIL
ncbi:MAG: GNAT family N-acetyltransferase [Candidatus Thorarchaeota archaeon]|jgi:N-acetylglutamate synthase-like GNAT family acetyltransferase